MADLNSQEFDIFSFLTQRLSWPVPMVRWKAGREIRDLLENKLTRDRMTSQLFETLDACRTESEVCSILNLFLLTNKDARPERPALISHIGHPSILADYILERMYGWGKGIGRWLTAHSGPAPLGFTESDYFKKHKTAHVPPVFWHRLQELEEQTYLPFVRQWAFEWEALCKRTGTRFTRYPDYFDDVKERRSGIVGQYQQGQTEVLRSAYIRIFALAVSKWNMPQERAMDELFDHIPAISGLFDLEPVEKPTWLESFPHDCLDDAADLKAALQKFVAKVRGTDEQVLSFTSPFEIEDARHGHVQLSAFLATDDFVLKDKGGPFEPDEFCDARMNLTIETEWPNKQIEAFVFEGRTGQAVPVCHGVLPVPHGHWMGHYFSTGIPVIASYCLPGAKKLRVRHGTLELVVDGVPASVTSIWHSSWSPHYAQDGGHTRNGVSVKAASNVLKRILEGQSHDLKLGWLLKVKVWKRDKEYGDYELKDRQVFVFDDEI